MKEAIRLRSIGTGHLVFKGDCLFISLFGQSNIGNAGDVAMQVFDSDKEPEVGDLPVRVLRLPPNTLGTVDVHGGRRMKRGIWIAVSNGGNLGFAAAVDNPDTTALLDVAYETHEAKPKPVDLLPILEKLTMRLEALPQVPVTPQATRPANTTKPAR